MKLQFTTKSKELAKKFAAELLSERSISSTTAEKDGKFIVEYSVDMDLSVASWMGKKKKKSKSGCKKKKAMSKADMGMEPEKEDDEEEEDDSVCMEDMCSMMNSLAGYFMSELQYQTNWLAAEIAYVESAFYKHVSNGHLPPINGADKMGKALEVLGVAGDYEIQKPVVYASSRYGTSMEVDISSKK